MQARLGPRIVLAGILVLAGVLYLYSGRGLSFSGDDFSYFGRQVLFDDLTLEHFGSLTPEYLLIPHNGHLQAAGKLLYELTFSFFGSDYTAFRVVATLGVLLCLALFYELAERRVSAPLALLGTALLALLGAAWEVQLWAFDLHTTFALAAGLGALLALERRSDWADGLACALLVVSCTFIEVGLVFVLAAVAGTVIAPKPWRRAWVYVVPAMLFVTWYLWAQRYDFPGAHVNLGSLIPSFGRSLGAVSSSLTGTLETGEYVSAPVVGGGPGSIALGLGIATMFAIRIWRTGFPRTMLPFLVALLGYWVLIAFASRAEDSSRYMLVGSVLLLLVVAESLRGWRPGRTALALCSLFVLVALPGNLAKLGDGGAYLRTDASLTRGEITMFELAGDRANPGYLTIADPAALEVGASPYIVMNIAEYFDAAQLRGSIANPLAEVVSANVFERTVFDVVLIDALGVGLEASRLPGEGACSVVGHDAPSVAQLPLNGALLRAEGGLPVALGLSRFVIEHPAKGLGLAEPGQWYRLALPGSDRADEPWRLFLDGPLKVCPLP